MPSTKCSKPVQVTSAGELLNPPRKPSLWLCGSIQQSRLMSELICRHFDWRGALHSREHHAHFHIRKNMHESHVELLVGVFGPAPEAPAPKIRCFFSGMPCKPDRHLKKHDPRALPHARRCAWERWAPLSANTEVHSGRYEDEDGGRCWECSKWRRNGDE